MTELENEDREGRRAVCCSERNGSDPAATRSVGHAGPRLPVRYPRHGRKGGCAAGTEPLIAVTVPELRRLLNALIHRLVGPIFTEGAHLGGV